MPDYYCTLTMVGAGKLAQAGLLGQPLTITHAAVGDGNPTSAEPSPETVLVSEKYRSAVNTVYSPEEDPSVVIVEMAVPVEDGDWEVNEVGLFDSVGDLVAIANYPKTWKPKVSSGTGRVLLIRIMVDVGNVEHVTLLVDPAMVMATRQYVDTLAAGMIRHYDTIPAQNRGTIIYVWPLGIMRWFGDWYRSVECGQIRLIGRPTPEPGTIKANGAILNKLAAAGLWSWAQEAGVVVPLVSWQPGTPFYAEISATEFMVPDLRAEHLRAWDDTRGADSGRGFGSWQDSANKQHAHAASSDAKGGHAHAASSVPAGMHAHAASSDSGGAHTHNVHFGDVTPEGSDLGTPNEPRNPINGVDNPTVAVSTTTAGAHAHNITVNGTPDHSHAITVDAVANHSHAITVDANGGAESRGRNVALLAVIHL
ncbi:phage tail protein [Pseudomonas sp. NPDC086251]|uniref:phage tail protein n=1 Tax=Pseudomonas sp. NPDC086251 TaxID=3364431 RepID=UPI0038376A21